jgi:hypothetical protein
MTQENIDTVIAIFIVLGLCLVIAAAAKPR